MKTESEYFAETTSPDGEQEVVTDATCKEVEQDIIEEVAARRLFAAGKKTCKTCWGRGFYPLMRPTASVFQYVQCGCIIGKVA